MVALGAKPTRVALSGQAARRALVGAGSVGVELVGVELVGVHTLVNPLLGADCGDLAWQQWRVPTPGHTAGSWPATSAGSSA
jgi:hypothetical protein